MKIEFDIDIEKIKKEVEKELSETWSKNSDKTTKEKVNELFEYSLRTQVNKQFKEEIVKIIMKENKFFSEKIKERVCEGIKNIEKEYVDNGYTHIRNPIFDGNHKNIYGIGLKLQNYISEENKEEIMKKVKDRILNILETEKEESIFEIFGEFMSLKMQETLKNLLNKK